MVLAFGLLLVRRRKLRATGRCAERRLYQAIITVSLVVWSWNALPPTTALFRERVGLYCGLNNHHAVWRMGVARRPGRRAIAHTGGSSLAVRFESNAGWVIFRHFPNSPPVSRYAAMEFYVYRHDLKTESPRVALLS